MGKYGKKSTTMNTFLTRLIINPVENRMINDEKRKVLAFVEKQDNVKIETNINEIAKIVSGKKLKTNSITNK